MARRKKADDGSDASENGEAKVRFTLSPEQKQVVLETRMALGRSLSENNVPAVLRGEAERLLSMNNTQLYRKVERAIAR